MATITVYEITAICVISGSTRYGQREIIWRARNTTPSVALKSLNKLLEKYEDGRHYDDICIETKTEEVEVI